MTSEAMPKENDREVQESGGKGATRITNNKSKPCEKGEERESST